MMTPEFIEKRSTGTLKKGDKVKMHTCGEAEFYKDKIWICRTESYEAYSGEDVVHLEGFVGSFSCKFLVKI